MRFYTPEQVDGIAEAAEAAAQAMQLKVLTFKTVRERSAATPVPWPIETHVEQVYGRLLFELRARVLAETLADDTQSATIQVPATWWQHFKLDMRATPLGRRWLRTRLGAWAAARSPVQYRTEVLKVRWVRYGVRPYSTLHEHLPADVLGPIVYHEEVQRWQFQQ